MAIDYSRESRRVSEQVAKLQAATSETNHRLADQIQFQLGTNRRSEIYGLIGGKGKPYQQAFNEYLDSL